MRAWFGVGEGAFPAEEGTVYVVGGCNEQSCADPLSSMLGYRPAHDAWFTMPSEFELPQPRFEFSLAVLGGDRCGSTVHCAMHYHHCSAAAGCVLWAGYTIRTHRKHSPAWRCCKSYKGRNQIDQKEIIKVSFNDNHNHLSHDQSDDHDRRRWRRRRPRRRQQC